MEATNIRRKYSITDTEMYSFASRVSDSLADDLQDFSKFGLTTEKINYFKSLIDKFISINDDIIFKYDLKVFTDQRNETKAKLLETTVQMALRVELKWTKKSTQYKNLGIKGHYKMNDSALYSAAKRIHSVMVEYLPDLASAGLTQAMLNEYEALINTFEIQINEQLDKKNLRNVVTIE